MEVLYCRTYGGFCLSQQALLLLFQQHPELFPVVDKPPENPERFLQKNRGGYLRDDQGQVRFVCTYEIDLDRLRSDPRLLQVVRQVGLEESSGPNCRLAIESIPEGYHYEIDEYDGWETVRTVFPYAEVIQDLLEFHRTGLEDFKSSMTRRLIAGEIDPANDFLPREQN